MVQSQSLKVQSSNMWGISQGLILGIVVTVLGRYLTFVYLDP